MQNHGLNSMRPDTPADTICQKPSFTARQIDADTWCIEGYDVGANMYLVKGDDHTLLIDNGYGEYDCRAFAESVCGCPVAWTALTHGHFDHAGGCQFFDRVFMTRAAEAEAKTPYPSLADQTYDFGYPIEYIADGSLIDLGGRTLRVIEVPSHSVGDAAFLDADHRILFGGDAIGSHVNLMWPQEEPQPTVALYMEGLQKVKTSLSDFDRIYVGHGGRPDDASCITDLIENAQRILDGYPGEVPQERPMMAPPGKGARPGDNQTYGKAYRRESEWHHTSIGFDCRYIR